MEAAVPLSIAITDKEDCLGWDNMKEGRKIEGKAYRLW